MSVYSLADLGARFNNYIKANFQQLITGPMMNGILHDIIDSVNNWLGQYILASDYRSGTAQLTEGVTLPINFSTSYPDGTAWTFTGKPFCYDADGNEVGYTITNRTKSGFSITAVADSTVEFHTKKV